MKQIVILFLILSSVPCAFSSGFDNTQSGIDKNIWPESPHAATVREVTSPQPALLTGAAEFSVPLYSMDAEGLTLPFNFRYHSNGIRVLDDPYPWGYGWSLTPCIRMSRQIIGRPDGLFKSVLDCNDYGETLNHCIAFHCMNDSNMRASDAYIFVRIIILTLLLTFSLYNYPTNNSRLYIATVNFLLQVQENTK